MKTEAQVRYDAEKKSAIEKLNSLKLESMPLDVAAAMLPVLPEWHEFQKKPRKRRVK